MPGRLLERLPDPVAPPPRSSSVLPPLTTVSPSAFLAEIDLDHGLVLWSAVIVADVLDGADELVLAEWRDHRSVDPLGGGGVLRPPRRPHPDDRPGRCPGGARGRGLGSRRLGRIRRRLRALGHRPGPEVEAGDGDDERADRRQQLKAEIVAGLAELRPRRHVEALGARAGGRIDDRDRDDLDVLEPLELRRRDPVRLDRLAAHAGVEDVTPMIANIRMRLIAISARIEPSGMPSASFFARQTGGPQDDRPEVEQQRHRHEAGDQQDDDRLRVRCQPCRQVVEDARTRRTRRS